MTATIAPSAALLGTKAPPFSLPSAMGQIEDVGALMGKYPVVLLFVPLAFSSICTQAACHMRDAWAKWTELGAKVFIISVDSPFVVARWRADEKIPFPVLSDFNREVCQTYGCMHEVLAGLKGVAKRSAFVIGLDGKIAYRWVSEDAKVQVDFAALEAAVRACK